MRRLMIEKGLLSSGKAEWIALCELFNHCELGPLGFPR